MTSCLMALCYDIMFDGVMLWHQYLQNFNFKSARTSVAVTSAIALGEIQRQNCTAAGIAWVFILARSSKLNIWRVWPAVNDTNIAFIPSLENHGNLEIVHFYFYYFFRVFVFGFCSRGMNIWRVWPVEMIQTCYCKNIF